jgi:hypothetical protein
MNLFDKMKKKLNKVKKKTGKKTRRQTHYEPITLFCRYIYIVAFFGKSLDSLWMYTN